MTSKERPFWAYLDEMNIVTILLPMSYHDGVSTSFSLMSGNEPKPLEIIQRSEIDGQMKYICRYSWEIPFGMTHYILDMHGTKTDLQIGAVIRTEEFDRAFYYDGNDLGTNCQPGQTSFKVWAPTATQVKLKLRPPDESFSEIHKMKRGGKGVWSIEIPKDLDTFRYTYLLLINQEWREAVDPYVQAVSANSELGVIVKMGPRGLMRQVLPLLENPVDSIIYETHIRDFSIHPASGVNHKGLYLGAGERSTKGNDGNSTGLSYLKELGITHIEVMPIHDFAGVDELDRKSAYNWGYNPIHFNVPEGSYSTNPHDPYSRIKELKSMIENIHRSGLRIILDVVYNHVYIRENSPFEKIVPGYYFRHNEFGLPSNGTGVGNDIASERRMVRKFILDSVRFWLEEYQVDGFRFDLMGILDITTMNEVRKVCDEHGSDILIIGEGWNLNTPLPPDQKAIIRNQSKLPRIAMFNDRFRDCIKGSTFNLFDKGYALGSDFYYEDACESLSGSVGYKQARTPLFQEPSQTVNYVECHDNHTLWDKLEACCPDLEEGTRMKRHRLATALVLLAQGIPFLHSGQEFFRTKYGEGNSYRSPDSINQLDWGRKINQYENVEYIKEIIRVRKMLSCFRMRTRKEILSKITSLNLPVPLIGFWYENDVDYKDVLLLVNPLNQKVHITIPLDKWSILFGHDSVGISSKSMEVSGEVSLEPISVCILAKK